VPSFLVDRAVCPFDRSRGMKDKPCYVCALGISRQFRGYDTCPCYQYRATAVRLEPRTADAIDTLSEKTVSG